MSVIPLSTQVQKLMDIFQYPITISTHYTPDGKVDSCCEIALTRFSSIIRGRYGLFGALTEMASHFKWGFARCEHICECVSEAENLDCGSGMSLALTLLNPIKGNYHLATVEIIIRHSQFNTTIWKHRIADENKKMTPEELAQKAIWIEDDCHYHTCIGLISKPNPNEGGYEGDELDLKVWDFGLWILPSHSPRAFNARLAIRVKLHSDQQLASSSPQIPKLRWGNQSINHGEWVNLWPNLDQNFTVHDLLTTSNITSLPSKVCISGCHMSGSPCPGVGLARSLRFHYPNLPIIAVDTAEDLASAACDPIFTSRLSLPGVMAPSFSGQYSDWQVLEWDLVYEILSTDPAAIYLPSRDSDIDIIASGLDAFAIDKKPPSIKNQHTTIYDLDLTDRVLCPSLKALDAMAKPAIYGACKSTNAVEKDCHPIKCFEVPEYLDMSEKCKSLYEMQDFCNRIGYPVILKGGRQGAAVCNTWFEVTAQLESKWAKDGFVQKMVVGFSMGLCFAAYKGELLGAVLMQKNVVTGEGKAWGGELRQVPEVMLNELALFCKSVNFTGGSELEYVEDINGTLWAIDWNPRFPAYIYATHLAGLNLPSLIMNRCVADMVTRNSYNIPNLETIANNSILTINSPLTLASNAGINFTRTVIETIDTFGTSSRTGGGGTMIFASYSGKSRHHDHKADHRHHHKEKLPNLPDDLILSKESDSDDEVPLSDTSSLSSPNISPLTKILQKDLSYFTTYLPEPTHSTPHYLLSTAAATNTLKTQKEALEEIHLQWKKTWTSTNSTPPSNFKIQPFLSVKTQPHQALLKTAHDNGFYAECITIAEIRASLAAGFNEDEIILTGPGKFWEGPDVYEMPKTLNLRAIFADSLEDLRRIISLTTNSHSSLRAETVGVRLSLGEKSRFGINSHDPQTLLDTACLLKLLPNDIKLGFHFHHASSNLGPDSWWCAVESFLTLTASLASISNKTVSVLDFGGGWQPHFLSRPETEEGMIKLFNKMVKYHPFVQAVQFEPGKSVSERCGALVCRVLEIREYIRSHDTKFPSSVPDEVEVSSEDSVESDRRACIVDACIAELAVSALHVHPLMWRPRISSSNSWSIIDHDGTTKGSDTIWGRSCMEFDVVSNNIILPAELAIGDYVMIAFTGAYDTVMQYDFADGLGRELKVIN